MLELGEMKVEGDEGEGVTKPAIYNRPTQPPPPLSQPRVVHHDLQIHSRLRADLPRDVRQANARPSREHPVEHAAHQVAPAHRSMAQRDFVPRQTLDASCCAHKIDLRQAREEGKEGHRRAKIERAWYHWGTFRAPPRTCGNTLTTRTSRQTQVAGDQGNERREKDKGAQKGSV